MIRRTMPVLAASLTGPTERIMETGICPVCTGSGRRPAAGVPSKTVYASYDAATDTLGCNNCGGLIMWGKPSGLVPLREDGTPCVHEYTSYSRGRCWTQYKCKFCTLSFDVDSGD